MKTIVMALTLLTTVAFAQDQSTALVLDKAKLNYGALKQDTNAAAMETITVKRTAKSPRKAVLKYSMNFLTKGCAKYDYEFTEVKGFSHTVCEANQDGSNDCRLVEVEAYRIPKRVCVEEGMLMKSTTRELALDFKKAVTLTPDAEEIFEITLKQTKMADADIQVKARAVNTASVYKVKVRRNKKIKFSAK